MFAGLQLASQRKTLPASIEKFEQSLLRRPAAYGLLDLGRQFKIRSCQTMAIV